MGSQQLDHDMAASKNFRSMNHPGADFPAGKPVQPNILDVYNFYQSEKAQDHDPNLNLSISSAEVHDDAAMTQETRHCLETPEAVHLHGHVLSQRDYGGLEAAERRSVNKTDRRKRAPPATTEVREIVASVKKQRGRPRLEARNESQVDVRAHLPGFASCWHTVGLPLVEATDASKTRPKSLSASQRIHHHSPPEACVGPSTHC